MTSSLPPDPYAALNLSKDAQLAEIRSAHRKLVLKCHPDKVQDPELKAIKQDEFQKVQQAYELLTDDKRRKQYDEQLRLVELRKELGRNPPSAGKNVFDYEVRTAEYRPPPSTRTKSTSAAPSTSSRVHVYTTAPGSPRVEEPRYAYRTEKKPSTSEKRSSREEEKRRREKEERRELERQLEKERERELREKEQRKAAKKRDKERKRNSEEKLRSRIDDDDSGDYPSPRRSERKASPPVVERKSSRRHEEDRYEEKTSRRAERSERVEESNDPLLRKLVDAKTTAAEYIERKKRTSTKSASKDQSYDGHPATLRRAETYDTASFKSSPYMASPPVAHDDSDVYRSAARSSTRNKSSEHVADRSTRSYAREKSSEAYVAEPQSSPPRKPTLQTHISEPPIMTTRTSRDSRESREKPSRSKTLQSEYSRKEAKAPPHISRATTFTAGERIVPIRRFMVEATSDSEGEAYSSQQFTRSYGSGQQYETSAGAAYIKPHHTVHRNDYNERERSVSPKRSAERGYVYANYTGASSAQLKPPFVIDATPSRPPKPSREASTYSYDLSNVKYGQAYTTRDVDSADYPYRRGSDPSYQEAYGNDPYYHSNASYRLPVHS